MSPPTRREPPRQERPSQSTPTKDSTYPKRTPHAPTVTYVGGRERVLGRGGRYWLANRILDAYRDDLDGAIALLIRVRDLRSRG